MKFKEIKQGVAVHCPKIEDAKMLLTHLDNLGYIWNNGTRPASGSLLYYGEDTGYLINDYCKIEYRDCSLCREKVIEFSDIVDEVTEKKYVDADTLKSACEDKAYPITVTADGEKYGANGLSVGDLNRIIDELTITDITEPDANTGMSAVDMLKWFKKYSEYENGIVMALFGCEYLDNIIEEFSPEEIIRRIATYEDWLGHGRKGVE